MKEIDDTQNICPYCHKDNKGYIADAHVLPAGTLLNEKYLVGAVLGEGGFGITYIARNLLLNIPVAIKEFYPTGMVTRNNTRANTITSISEEKAQKLFSESKDIFWKEAKILAEFNSEPSIVSVLDYFSANNTAYIVTEFLEGETLAEYLKRVGIQTFDNAFCILMPVMESLIKIHEKNLIHRDISPDNIMLVGDSVKLIDFGATRQYADNKSLSVILKEGYAPVEQYSSKGNQGTWTDVYALCAVLYRCITGIVPIAASERMSTDEEIKLTSELGLSLYPEVEQVLMKGLALKPKDRIQTVEELIKELTNARNKYGKIIRPKTLYVKKPTPESNDPQPKIMNPRPTEMFAQNRHYQPPSHNEGTSPMPASGHGEPYTYTPNKAPTNPPDDNTNENNNTQSGNSQSGGEKKNPINRKALIAAVAGVCVLGIGIGVIAHNSKSADNNQVPLDTTTTITTDSVTTTTAVTTDVVANTTTTVETAKDEVVPVSGTDYKGTSKNPYTNVPKYDIISI